MATPEICPNCGALVPPRARACPECGADDETGWSDRATAQRLGLPDDEFDYDEFVKEEFGSPRPADRLRPRGISWLWWVVAVVLVVLSLGWLTGLSR